MMPATPPSTRTHRDYSRPSGSDVWQATDKMCSPRDNLLELTHSIRNLSRPILALGAALLLFFALTTFSMPSRAIEEREYQFVREFADI